MLTPELTENCIEFICKSQTYEGGIGPYPGKEAHNGYTFCGLAAMEVLDGMSRLNLDRLTVIQRHIFLIVDLQKIKIELVYWTANEIGRRVSGPYK